MRYKINLIDKKKEDAGEKIVFFSLNYLRYILVVTQIIVIAVFFYRFKVDQRIVDIKESLKQKQEIVKISKPLIDDASLYNSKIKKIGKILKKQDNFTDNLDNLLEDFPQAIRLTKLEITDSGYRLEGVTNSVSVLKIFYSKIKRKKNLSASKLKTVDKEDLGYHFIMELSPQNKKTKI